MKKIFVNQIQEREWIESPFLVRDKLVGMAKNGKPYLSLKLMDRSGEIEGRVWDRVDELTALFERNDFIVAAGKASLYLGKMQLVIQELSRLDESQVELADFLPVSSRPVAEMVAELRSWVAGFGDPHLRRLMEAFLNDAKWLAAFSRAPAAKAMHHVYLGGLLEHSLAVAALADDICRHYPGLRRDLLITGALLHDVGKISELRFERSFEYSDAGKLLGHIVIGVELVEEKLRQLGDFPMEQAILLKHLLLSHHGQYEYGSPKRPKTLEAVVLNFIDDLDSKINGVRTHLDKEADSDSGWTQYHRLYDRYFFKGFAEGSGEDGGAARVAPPVPADPAPVAAVPPPRERPAASRSAFNNALGDQLRGLTPSLFAPAGEEPRDE